MKNLLLSILSILFLNTAIASEAPQGVNSHEETNSIPAESSKPKKKELKTLVLIIATDNMPAYLELQKVWKTYMHSDPEHFEVYFLRADPDLATPYVISQDSITVKTEEGLRPGILNKTILALDAFAPRLKEFDYVIRTNLSSFYVFPKLLNTLELLPRERSYGGVMLLFNNHENADLNVVGASGAGIILSRDVAELLLSEKDDLSKYDPVKYADDVVIAYMLQSKNVIYINAPRVDFPSKDEWLNHQDRILNSSFHFRAKSYYDFRKPEEAFNDELFINKELLKRYYPNLTTPS